MGAMSELHWQEGKSAKALKFATTPAEKAEETWKKFLKVCKDLGMDPATFGPKKRKSGARSTTHQPTDTTVDGATKTTKDYKHVVRLKGQ